MKVARGLRVGVRREHVGTDDGGHQMEFDITLQALVHRVSHP